jgi:hypothetical protein
METVIGALIDVAAPRATSCERAATRSARVPQPLPLDEALSALSEGQFLGHHPVADWRARLACSQCGSCEVDMVVTGQRR